jgi:hypothetical protein
VPELGIAWTEGWLWLSGSLLAAVVSANLIWLFHRSRSETISRFSAQVSSSPIYPWLFQILRLLYYLGVPFAALVWGHDAIVERILGMKRLLLPLPESNVLGTDIATNWLNWAQDIGWGAAIGVGSWMLLALGWWAYRRVLDIAGEQSTTAREPGSGWLFLREAAYHEFHWAFYRNAPVLALGAYWGAWTGLALVTIETALNPAWRTTLADPQQAPGQLMRGALGVVSTILFLMTQNLWLALIVHWGVSWGLYGLGCSLPLSNHQPHRDGRWPEPGTHQPGPDQRSTTQPPA